MSCSDDDIIRLYHVGKTPFAIEVGELFDPVTLRSPTDLNAVAITLVVTGKITASADVSDDPTVRNIIFSEADATALGANVHSFDLLGDFGSGPFLLGTGRIAVGRP